jgi:rRNA processing protein Krr1/Pno1
MWESISPLKMEKKMKMWINLDEEYIEFLKEKWKRIQERIKWTSKFNCRLKENYGRLKIKFPYVHHFSWQWQ